MDNQTPEGELYMKAIRMIGKVILITATMPLLMAAMLMKWFGIFLFHCSAWVLYLFASILLAAAAMSFLMGQTTGGEVMQMLLGGFIVFLIPQMVGGFIATMELVTGLLRSVWYI